MNKRAGVLLDDGFEDAEALVVYSMLHHAGIAAEIISCCGKKRLSSYFGHQIDVPLGLNDVADTFYDALILTGGKGATQRIASNPQAIAFIRKHDRAGKLICAISSACTRILSANQLLEGRCFTCADPFWHDVHDGVYLDQPWVIDGHLITAKGLGTVFPFSQRIIDTLTGPGMAYSG